MKGNFTKILVVATTLIAGLFAGFCSGSTESSDNGFAHVNMIDNTFSPEIIRIPENGIVQFRNIGGNPHNAIAVDKSWGTDKTFGKLEMLRGQSTKVTFPKKGVFPYLCTFHADPEGKVGMVGAVLAGEVTYTAGRTANKKATGKYSGITRRVPATYPTIQNAVDASSPGDMVLIAPGVYKEEVKVTTPSLIIRGQERNAVIIDGEFIRANGLMVLGADGVAVENLTTRNARLNGIFFTGVKGYRASYVTAYNNADYGVYAFDSTDGLIEHSYASGSPDSGFYIGQCDPCRAVIRDVVAENNALGYSGTNSSGDIYIINSIWRKNIVGLAPNSLDRELLPPEHDTIIAGNLVIDNNNMQAPYGPLEYPSFGNGIIVAGGLHNTIMKNLVVGHLNNGILLMPNLDERIWTSHHNLVQENTVLASGRADLSVSGPFATGNCFSKNFHISSIPPLVQTIQNCESGIRVSAGSDFSMNLAQLGMLIKAVIGGYEHGSVKKQPIPPPQMNMPDEIKKNIRPAFNEFEIHKPNLAEIKVPVLSPADQAKFKSAPGYGPLMPMYPRSLFPLIFHYLGFFLPLATFIIWTFLAIQDISLRGELSPFRKSIFYLVAAFLPYLGAGGWLLFGQARYPRWLKIGIFLIPIAGMLFLVGMAAGVLSSGIPSKQLD